MPRAARVRAVADPITPDPTTAISTRSTAATIAGGPGRSGSRLR